MPVGSIRPPPVHFPVGHCAGGGVTQKLGRFGAMLTFGRSLHATASSPAAKPGPKRRIVCVSMLRLLAGSSTRDSCGEARGKTGASRGAFDRLLWNREIRCSVAVMHRGAHIRCGASVVAPTLERARHSCDDGSGCVATLYGAPRGAACGPLPAGRCIAHSPTSSVTHTRDVSQLCLTRSASARAQRLRDG